MIYGLGAALGWGIADLWAAVSSRRIGTLTTLVVAQTAGAVLVTLLVVLSGTDLSTLGRVVGWLVPGSLLMAGGYYTLYRGLALGPIAVVSPVLATYAVIPVVLAVILLGETLAAVVVLGIALTILGAALTSTDLRALGSGLSRRPEGLPWAIASLLLFGVGAFIFGWAAKTAGWMQALWLSRTEVSLLFLAVGLAARSRRQADASMPGSGALAFAALIGVADLLGAVMFARGAELGYISIVTAASATYPIVPVLGGVMLFRERPAPNQFIGVALVIFGLLAVGLG